VAEWGFELSLADSRVHTEPLHHPLGHPKLLSRKAPLPWGHCSKDISNFHTPVTQGQGPPGLQLSFQDVCGANSAEGQSSSEQRQRPGPEGRAGCFVSTTNIGISGGPGAHACNPSYPGGRDRKIRQPGLGVRLKWESTRFQPVCLSVCLSQYWRLSSGPHAWRHRLGSLIYLHGGLDTDYDRGIYFRMLSEIKSVKSEGIWSKVLILQWGNGNQRTMTKVEFGK
jgi:hypothetical protein